VVAGRDALSLPRASWTGLNVWDKAQADKFLAVMQGHRLEGWFLIALIHGLRMSEILGLQWEDIDLVHDTMKIRRQLQDGKLVALKTGSAAVRSIRLHPSVLHVLKKMDNREGFLFVNGASHPHGGTAIRRALAWGTKKARLPRLTVHAVRHTALTILAAHGVGALTLQRMAGHASLSTTQRYIRASALDERAGEILRDVWK
jgi:integrase